MLHSQQYILGSIQFLFGVDQRGQDLGEVADSRIAVPDGQRQRFETALPGDGGKCAFLGLERKIEIFEPFGRVGGSNGGAKFLCKLALTIDAPEDCLLALG